MKKRNGTINTYHSEKGWGWITEVSADGKPSRHFFHISRCLILQPRDGMVVTFELGTGRNGPAAVDVERYVTPTTANNGGTR